MPSIAVVAVVRASASAVVSVALAVATICSTCSVVAAPCICVVNSCFEASSKFVRPATSPVPHVLAFARFWAVAAVTTLFVSSTVVALATCCLYAAFSSSDK